MAASILPVGSMDGRAGILDGDLHRTDILRHRRFLIAAAGGQSHCRILCGNGPRENERCKTPLWKSHAASDGVRGESFETSKCEPLRSSFRRMFLKLLPF